MYSPIEVLSCDLNLKVCAYGRGRCGGVDFANVSAAAVVVRPSNIAALQGTTDTERR